MEQIRRFINELRIELESERFNGFYQKLKIKYKLLERFPTPNDLTIFLHDKKSVDYHLKNEIISNLIYEYQSCSENDSMASYLLFLAVPGLLKISSFYFYRFKYLGFADSLDIWFQVVETFLMELKSIDVERERVKIFSKVLGRTRNKMRDWYNKFRRDVEDGESSPISPSDIESSLDELVQKRIISKTDLAIILATDVYKRNMKELKQELPWLSYDNIRQRKSRAKSKIWEYLRNKGR